MNFFNRFGSFLLILGGMGILLFLFSDIAQARNYAYLLAGVAPIAVGALFKSAAPKPTAEPSSRFSMIRRIRQQQLERSKARAQKKKSK